MAQHPKKSNAINVTGSDPGAGNFLGKADPSKDWLNTPGLTFGDGNAGYAMRGSEAFGIQMPEWAPPGMDNYAALYSLYQGMPEEARAGFVLEQESANQARRDRDAARNRGLTDIDNRTGELNESYRRWGSDPYRQQAMDELSRMSEPGYSIIGDRQQEAYNRQLAQNYAGNQASLDANQASRGTGGGGASFAQDAMLEGTAGASALQVNAQVDEANETARRAAVDSLSRVGIANKEIDLRYEGALDSLSRMSAAIEAGEEYSPSEFLGYAELGDAMRRADAEEAFRMEQLDIMRQAAKKDIWDWVSLGMDTIGTGLWDVVL